MVEQLIGFKTAVLGKEKKFNEECFYYYDKNNKLQEPYLENGSSTDTGFRVDLSDLLESNNLKYNKTISAPTQSLLAKWLREKHNILVFVNYHSFGDESCNGYYYHIGNSINNPIHEKSDTYEEALETGLQEALILI